MSRGLSQLQKAILEMAYEWFLESAKERDFEGLHYRVGVGPDLPTDDWHPHYAKYERYYTRNSYLLNGRRLFEAANEAAEADLESIKAKRAKIERDVESAAPDLVDRFGPGCFSEGALRNWHEIGDDAEGVPWHNFVVAGGYDGFLNNTGEARRINERVRAIGGWYAWWGYDGVYTGEILERVYGFEPKIKVLGSDYHRSNSLKFDPKEIGEERYNRARASVSRALKRLENRMLIDHAYGVAYITLEGIAALTGLTVNEVCRKHNINRTDAQRKVVIRGKAIPKREPVDLEKQAKNGAVVQGLRDVLNPPPAPLADGLFNVIAEHIVRSGGATKAEIEEAFAEAMQRVVEMEENAQEVSA